MFGLGSLVNCVTGGRGQWSVVRQEYQSHNVYTDNLCHNNKHLAWLLLTAAGEHY